MNLFDNTNGETRQQRLALTWSGKNETVSEGEVEEAEAAEEQPVVDTRPRLTLTKPAPEPAVQEAVEAEAPAESEATFDPDETLDAEAVPARKATITLTKAAPVAMEEPVQDDGVDEEPELDVDAMVAELVEAAAAEKATAEEPIDVVAEAKDVTQMVRLTKKEAIVVEEESVAETPVEEDLFVEASTEIEPETAEKETIAETLTEEELVVETPTESVSEPEPHRPTLTLTKEPPTDVESEDEVERMKPEPLEETLADTADAPTEKMDREAATQESATYALPTPNPAELSHEFKMESNDASPEKDPIEMEQPKKITLAKAAVIPEPDEEETLARPALKLTKDPQKTTNLKPKREVKKNNTCRLKPDTSEIVAESLGGKLRAARELAGLSEYELAEKTRISSEYIISLENEAFADLPLAPIYIKSYLKTLARQFGLNSEELITLYEEKTGELSSKKQVKKDPEPTISATDSEDAKTSKWLNRSIAAVAAAVVLLMIAGVLIKTLGGRRVTAEDLQVISNDELCDSIRTTYLPARHLPIPGHETAAMRE